MIEVPDGFQGLAGSGPSSGAGTTRRVSTPASRTATWSSWSVRARTDTRRFSAVASTRSGRSTRPPHSFGCSSEATRPSPHVWACAGRARTSERRTETAVRVAHHRGASRPSSVIARSRASTANEPTGSAPCTGCGRSSKLSSDSTPESVPGSATASPSRSATSFTVSLPPSTSSTTTFAPCSPSTVAQSVRAVLAASASGTASTHVPFSKGDFCAAVAPEVPWVPASASGCHVTRYRHPATAESSLRFRCQLESAGSTLAREDSPLSARSRVLASSSTSPRSTTPQNSASTGSCPPSARAATGTGAALGQ